MKKLLLPILFLLVIGGAVFGGGYMKHEKDMKTKKKESVDFTEKKFNYVKLDKPLIIPIFHNGKTSAILVAELWLEMEEEFQDGIYEKQPRIRDEFLQIFYRYAAEGQFDDKILTPKVQARLRKNLTEGARKYLGKSVRAVLLNDLQRQEM